VPESSFGGVPIADGCMFQNVRHKPRYHYIPHPQLLALCSSLSPRHQLIAITPLLTTVYCDLREAEIINKCVPPLTHRRTDVNPRYFEEAHALRTITHQAFGDDRETTAKLFSVFCFLSLLS